MANLYPLGDFFKVVVGIFMFVCFVYLFKLLQIYIKEFTEKCKNFLVSMSINGKDIELVNFCISS